MKKLLVLLVVVVVLAAGGGGAWYWFGAGPPAPQLRTATVSRGDILAGISATGTLEPEEVIDIGAQVAGQIDKFGADPHNPGKTVDYGTEVEEGTVLAHIDDALYAADVDSAQAALETAKANVARAEADLGQMRAKLKQGERDLARAKRLSPSNAMTQAEMDAAEAAYETAKSGLAVGEATVVQMNKTVAQSEANLKRAERNLNYCTIKSPVKGVIVDRRVNVGQTVVASLNAPSLFLIAKDLKRMQVWASVNEADIGLIHKGQAVRFTVDAHPNDVFEGTVNKVRLNATMTSNVVTYTVEVTTDNSSGKLLPYLTANLKFEVDQRTNALLVPNAALNWKPKQELIAPDARGGGQKKGGKGEANKEAHDRGVVWVRDGAFVRPVPVKIGLTDGQNTEVVSGELPEGTEVVIGEVSQGGGGGANNPFAPKMFGGGGGGGGGRQ